MRLVRMGLAAAVLLAGREGANAEDLSGPLVCTFAVGISGSYEAGGFQTKPPGPISFEIADINLDGQSASIATGSGGTNGKLAIARAIGANHFLEIGNEGFWNITTIYDKDATTGAHPAVHSRHSAVVGQPHVAQYTGICKAK